MKIKIMYVCQSAGGGAAVYVRMLLKNIDNTCYEQILIGSDYYKKTEYTDSVNYFENIHMERDINLFKDFCSLFALRRIIKRYKPDIIYCHSSKAGALGRIANIGLRAKVIYNPHGWSFNMKCSSIKKVLYQCIERFLACFTDVIIAISNYEKSTAVKRHIAKKDKIKVILNGIDIEKI
jgi:glycosyltransferase involved in cell wall biosynthesis